MRLLHPDLELIKRILNIGLPSGGESLLMHLGQTPFAIVASLRTMAYAAHQITMTSLSASFTPGFGFGVAATTLVGQRLSTGDPEGADGARRIAERVAMILMAISGAAAITWAPQFVGAFTCVCLWAAGSP